MYCLPNGGVKKRLVAIVPVALLALVVLWLGFRGSRPQLALDFEECVEQVQAIPPSNDERGALMTDCNARFAGRRKAGGGYTYYDFMQNRHFDIAGPNPTPQELKHIDEQYTEFLDQRRQGIIAAAFTEQQKQQTQADPAKEKRSRQLGST